MDTEGPKGTLISCFLLLVSRVLCFQLLSLHEETILAFVLVELDLEN